MRPSLGPGRRRLRRVPLESLGDGSADPGDGHRIDHLALRVPHVERVDDPIADGRRAGRGHVDPRLGQQHREVREPTDRIVGVPLDHGGRRRPEDVDLHRDGALSGRAASVRGGAGREPVREVRVPGTGPVDRDGRLLAPRRVAEPSEPVDAREHLERNARSVGRRTHRPHVEPGERERGRHGTEQPRAVRGHDRAAQTTLGRFGPLDREHPGGDGRLVPDERIDRADRAGRARVDRHLGPGHEVAHECRLRRAPRGGAGRARVGDRERVEQHETVTIADAADEPFDGDRVVEVASRRSVGEQQVVGDEPRHGLDRSRPLWELWFVEGLEEG
ncbi:MAG: wax ester/triacylglycerol synthase domain-containing protein, partial [Actinomycetota bacterium]